MANLGWKTNIKITSRYKDGRVEVDHVKNIITNDGLNMLKDGMLGNVTDLEIKYLAWGSDSTAPAVGDSTLVAETGRKQVTSKSSGGNGILDTVTTINNDQAVEQIEELGWFAGVNASASADTGILVARVLYSRNKTNLESVQVDRTDTIAEV